MSRIAPIFAALSLTTTLALLTTAGAADVKAPPGEMVVNPQCFGGVVEEMQARGGGSWSKSMPAAAAPAPTMSAAPPPPSMPAPAPSADAASSVQIVAGVARGANKRAEAKAKSPKPQRAERAQAEAAPMAPVAVGGLLSFDEEEAADDGDMDMVNEWAPPAEARPTGSSLDWGGTTWLSNDDSMSLASAQRVLWSAMNGQRAPLDEIRAHELLNYFSFDTDSPEHSDLFALNASAVTKGDQIQLALAVQGAMPDRRALDLTVLVDTSGSMNAEGRMDYTKRGLNQMLENLEKGDRIDLVTFNNSPCTAVENYVHGRDSLGTLERAIDGMRPGGGTNMNAGLQEAYRVAKAKKGATYRNRRVMVLTDANLNVGDVNHHTVSEVGRHLEEANIRLTGVGVGKQFNDDVLDKLTEKGKGAYVYLGSEAVVDRLFSADGFRSMTETIAHDVRFELDLPESIALEKFYGEEASTHKEDVQPINYYAGTSQLFLQDLAIKPGVLSNRDVITLNVHYRDAATGEPAVTRFKTTVGEMLGGDDHNLVKAQALMAWSDLLVADAMGGNACGAAANTWRDRASKVSGDAEIRFVDSLVAKRCGHVPLNTWTAQAAVPFKLKVDADIHIAEVSLACAGETQRSALSGGTSVARFEATPGECQVTLQGAVPMVAQVTVPKTGADVRCMVRGGRMSCGS